MNVNATYAAQPFGLHRVRLLDGPFKQAMLANLSYLHSLEPDRLLHTFRLNAGLVSSAEPYGGWETPDGELRGHCLGHYLTACALAWAAADDADLKSRGEYIVAELAKCQEAVGNGFLSAWPESFIDRAETCERVWAPYYTLHKICAGLLDMYQLCGDAQALSVLERKADWIASRFGKLSDEQVQKMLDTTEQGGMNEVLANLYAVSGNPAHIALSKKFNQQSYITHLQDHEDKLKGQHCNSYIPNVVGFARQYELGGEDGLRDSTSFFWQQVAFHRSYVTGGTSNYECWLAEPDCFADQLSPNSHETCCTYNMLKLARHIFTWTADPNCADFCERALFNGILPTINPADGMTMYYVPLQPGLYKTFGTPFNSFWCCTGTGMENHLRYGEQIYFNDEESLYVNQFIASELDWKEKGLTLRQETEFPETTDSCLRLSMTQPQDLTLKFRIPKWTTDGATLTVNDVKQEILCQPGTYAKIQRTWEDGDSVELFFPRSFHLEPMPDDPHTAAIMHGPLVLAGQLGADSLNDDLTHGSYGPSGYPVPVPDLVTESGDPDVWITSAVGGPLTFCTKGVGKPEDVQLKPFYKTFGRYTVYWYIGNEQEWQQRMAEIDALAQEPDITATVVDRVVIGDTGSEAAHNLQGERTETGKYLHRNWRQAITGGWFSYTLGVTVEKPVTLVLTYWGADAGGRMFDIMIDDTKIAEQVLDHLSPGKFVEVEYAIPIELTRGKEQITVRFQAHQPRRTAGGIFGCVLVERAGGK